MPDSWYPSANRVPTDKMTALDGPVRGIVLHIADCPPTDDGYHSTVEWLSNSAANPNSSAHFVVNRDGRVTQLVPIDHGAWANGLRWNHSIPYDPEGNSLAQYSIWPLLRHNEDPNACTISIEHVGRPYDDWPEVMLQADIQLIRWIAAQWDLHVQYGTTLIGHCNISPRSRAYCPGPHCPFSAIASAVSAVVTRYRVNRSVVRVRALPALVQDGKPVHTLRYMKLDELVDVIRIVKGQLYSDSDEWAELALGGYIWMPLLTIERS
jgi:N-acetyl-anhydromuramyl-L-alanine amidase AmpD